jgi:hypothetical protein
MSVPKNQRGAGCQPAEPRFISAFPRLNPNDETKAEMNLGFAG